MRLWCSHGSTRSCDLSSTQAPAMAAWTARQNRGRGGRRRRGKKKERAGSSSTLRTRPRGGRSASPWHDRTLAATRRATPRTGWRPCQAGPTCHRLRSRAAPSVCSPLLFFTFLTHLEPNFGKMPIGWNILLFELYKFVKRLDT